MSNEVWVFVKSYTTHDHWDGEPYGDWGTTKEYGGTKVRLSGSGAIGYHSEIVEVNFVPEFDKVVWAVVVEYSSGDTFGHSSGNTTVVGVYDDGVVASLVKGLIEEDYKDNHSGYGAIQVPGHQEIYSGTWKGYFESLENVHVERLHIEA